MLPTVTIRDAETLDRVVGEYLKHDAFVFDVESIGDVRGVAPLAPVAWISLACASRCDVIPIAHPHGNLIRPSWTEKEAWWDENDLTPAKKQPKKKWRTIRHPAEWTPAPKQLSHQEVFSALRPLLFGGYLTVGHNLKFDLEAVAKYYDGKIPTGPYFDTLLAANLLLHGNQKRGLKDLAKKYYGVVYPDKDVGKNVALHGFDEVATYSLLDASMNFLLFEDMEAALEREGLLDRWGIRTDVDLAFDSLWDMEMEVLPALCRMELEGAMLDEAPLDDLGVVLEDRLRGMLKNLTKAAGRVINPNSTADVQELVYETRGHKPFAFTEKTEQPKTSKGVLEAYSTDPVVAELLEYKSNDTLYGTFVGKPDENGEYTTGLRQHLHGGLTGGKIHPDFRQMGARTGRLSCAKPNLQNIPSRDERGDIIRAMFIAEPGWTLVVADYSQIEYRVLAEFSGDPTLLRAFEEGWDPHAAAAALIYGVALEEVLPEQRSTAKNFNFAVLYGAGLGKLAGMSGITLGEAEKFLRRHERQFPAIYSWKQQVLQEARRREPPHVVTIAGRRRMLPALNWSNSELRSAAERQAINTEVQGSAADVMKMAIAHVERKRPPCWKQILTVHDELMLKVPDEDADEAAKALQQWMEEINPLQHVRLVAEANYGKTWHDAK